MLVKEWFARKMEKAKSDPEFGLQEEEDMSFEPTVDNVFIYNEGFQDGKVEGRKEALAELRELSTGEGI
jgi:flagellar biosynthesis/type III secretory pathway protein FliH